MSNKKIKKRKFKRKIKSDLDPKKPLKQYESSLEDTIEYSDFLWDAFWKKYNNQTGFRNFLYSLTNYSCKPPKEDASLCSLRFTRQSIYEEKRALDINPKGYSKFLTLVDEAIAISIPLDKLFRLLFSKIDRIFIYTFLGRGFARTSEFSGQRI